VDRAVGVAVTVALALVAGCKKKSDDRPAPSHIDPTPLPEPMTADAVIAQAQAKMPGFRLGRLELVDVLPDGRLDPTTGTATFRFTTGGAELAAGSGSSRPTPVDCPTLTWESKHWTTGTSFCGGEQILAVRCPVLAIWLRAMDDGAPNVAHARFLMVARSAFDEPPPLWTIDISSATRDRVGRATYTDDCEPSAEAPTLPAQRPGRITLEEFNKIVAEPTAQAKIKACQVKHPTSQATFHLRVLPNAQIYVSSIDEGESELSACLLAAMATFPLPRTQGGSSLMTSPM